jgi:hypothetical protein
MQVRRDDERGVPVPAQRRTGFLFLWLDADPLARPLVIADDDAMLQFRVDRIGILRVHP